MSSVIHWLCRPGDLKTFCGIFAYLNTARAEQVTCQDCLALMRLHGHLPAPEDADENRNP